MSDRCRAGQTQTFHGTEAWRKKKGKKGEKEDVWLGGVGRRWRRRAGAWAEKLGRLCLPMFATVGQRTRSFDGKLVYQYLMLTLVRG